MSRPYALRANREFDFAAAERAMAGEAVALTPEERLFCVTVLTRQGESTSEIAQRLHMAERSVTRLRGLTPDSPGVDSDIPSPSGPPADVRDALIEWAATTAVCTVVSVRDIDPREVWSELSEMTRDQIQCLVIALAAMVPADESPQQLWSWTDDLAQKQVA